MNDLFQEIKVIVKDGDIIPIWSDRVSFEDNEDNYDLITLDGDNYKISITEALMNIKTKEIVLAELVTEEEDPKCKIGDVILVPGKESNTLKKDTVTNITYTKTGDEQVYSLYGKSLLKYKDKIVNFSEYKLYRFSRIQPNYHLKSGKIIGQTLFCQIYKLEEE